jgi:hypothetical protein
MRGFVKGFASTEKVTFLYKQKGYVSISETRPFTLN